MNKSAYIFPGQGSQQVGMLAEIASVYPEVKQTFTESSDVLHYDLWDLIQNGPVDQLNQTEYTQPALLTASIALWRLLQTKIDLQPAYLAGHSLGEYSALVCANAITFKDAVMLVAARGRFMQEAVTNGQGGMAAIVGLDNEKVVTECQQIANLNGVLSVANFNSIGQVVIAGDKTLIENAIEKFKSMGAKLAVLLPVSVPSHCELMIPAANRLEELLKTVSIQVPQFPIINNVDVIAYDSAESIRLGLKKQLHMPVRWVEIIQFFVKNNVQQLIECGPGKVLAGLNKRIDKSVNTITLGDLNTLQTFLNKGTNT